MLRNLWLIKDLQKRRLDISRTCSLEYVCNRVYFTLFCSVNNISYLEGCIVSFFLYVPLSPAKQTIRGIASTLLQFYQSKNYGQLNWSKNKFCSWYFIKAHTFPYSNWIWEKNIFSKSSLCQAIKCNLCKCAGMQ